MGCGQSKIGIYQRKSKSKKNGSKRSAPSCPTIVRIRRGSRNTSITSESAPKDGENDEETEEAEETINPETKDCGESEKRDEDADSVASKIKQMAQQQTGGAVLAQSDISSSQLDFFKMLDEKIENGPDYEESDEEEQLARMESLLQEWRAACLARQQKRNDQHDNWPSPARTAKLYQDDYETYPRRINPVDTQRFPTGYSQCPPNSTINIHLQNSFRMAAPYSDQPRMQPRIPIMGNYHPFQPPAETYNHCEDPTGHPLSTSDPPNPLRPNYSQVMLRQSSITSQHYPENQRLYSENIRQFSDFPRGYQDQRQYQTPRAMPTVNVLHEHRLYSQDINSRPYPMYGDESRQPEDVQRMMVDVRGSYHDPQRQDIRPSFMNMDNQRAYHERLKEKQRQFGQVEGPRTATPRAPIMAQRPGQDPSRIYRDLEGEDHCFQDGSSRVHNPNHFKTSRSLSVDVQYVAGPPPPREMIPLQGAPGPPQGSPRPVVARGLQTNLHRLPGGSVVHYRKPQGAFT